MPLHTQTVVLRTIYQIVPAKNNLAVVQVQKTAQLPVLHLWAVTVAGFIRDAQMNSMMASSKRFLVSEKDYRALTDQGQEEYLIEFLLDDGADINNFQSDYLDQGLPCNGPGVVLQVVLVPPQLSQVQPVRHKQKIKDIWRNRCV